MYFQIHMIKINKSSLEDTTDYYLKRNFEY